MDLIRNIMSEPHLCREKKSRYFNGSPKRHSDRMNTSASTLNEKKSGYDDFLDMQHLPPRTAVQPHTLSSVERSNSTGSFINRILHPTSKCSSPYTTIKQLTFPLSSASQYSTCEDEDRFPHMLHCRSKECTAKRAKFLAWAKKHFCDECLLFSIQYKKWKVKATNAERDSDQILSEGVLLLFTYIVDTSVNQVNIPDEYKRDASRAGKVGDIDKFRQSMDVIANFIDSFIELGIHREFRRSCHV
ncbi:hypothetical protein SARC_05000 [Sphaeroforma arctica JP610]|uniref:RGS domain-containing protein n=1 Tax=Sphaeroforma arctica JP610 TaxID=667725 RepID=A0A0L0G1L4_9EUKA|nr:hypothetical protein SARC_05000 [Sphaeroforma arctica JP610]KNC82729.1 hypothetical protein SARC_05000 [Sphaeroforma arctica JP610]|eukprot:XP_014156631.1 hypothetical protein SARC_05000 [Sphaeroforma arctica JP610]